MSCSPKYYANGCVVEGLEKRTSKIPLTSVLGMYRMIWGSELVGPVGTDNGTQITLSSNHPSDVSGTLEFGIHGGTFSACEAIVVDGQIPSTWQITMKWNEFSKGLPEDGHDIVIGNMEDDNGAPFLEMSVNCRWSGCCPTWITFVGKKQENETARVRLTATEKARLGMNKYENEFEHEQSGN